MDVKSVRELQNILGSYGVTFSGQKKCCRSRPHRWSGGTSCIVIT